MRYLELTVAPGETSIHPLFPIMSGCEFVDASWMLDWNRVRNDTTTALFRVRGDPEALADALEREPVVLDQEVRPTEGGCYAYMHTETGETEARLFLAFNQERSMLIPPLEYADGTVTCRIVGGADELRAALADVPEGVDATVKRVGEFDRRPTDVASLLTDRQLAVVRAAIDVGYYEVPREATAADVADRVDCATGTASEHLRKAEARLITSLLGEQSRKDAAVPR